MVLGERLGRLSVGLLCLKAGHKKCRVTESCVCVRVSALGIGDKATVPVKQRSVQIKASNAAASHFFVSSQKCEVQHCE